MSSLLNNQTLNLLTYNLYIRPPFITARGNDYKKDRLKDFLNNKIEDYDVICLQEVFGSFSSKRKEFIKKAKKFGFMYECHLHRPKSFPLFPVDGGCVILSRFPIEKTDQIIYTRGVYSDGLSAKGVLHALVDIGFADYSDDYLENEKSRTVRNKQLDQCFSFIKHIIAEDDYPVILCGDFNVCGGTKEYDDLMQLMNTYEMDPVDYLYEENGHLVTHAMTENGEAVDNVITSKTPAPVNVRLDYIFGTKNNATTSLKTEKCEVNRFETVDRKYPFLSDHFGVEASILL
ncbi:sphingomyelin phosphodiesterase [Entamoeba marina]